MLSLTESVSNRLKSWNTKPKLSRRKAETADSLILERFCPSKLTTPLVGLSKAAKMFKRVVLPDPDSPIIATYSPSSTLKDTFFKASTLFPPNRVV